jgi:hypothetical protein
MNIEWIRKNKGMNSNISGKLVKAGWFIIILIESGHDDISIN